MAKILLKLLLLLFAFVCVVHAIHDPKYEGIKTKTYRRDPLIAQAFDQQQQHYQPQEQQPNFHHSHNNYQPRNVDASERLSPAPIYSNNNNPYQSAQQQQPLQGGPYFEQQQELPIYQRNNHDARHSSTSQTGPAKNRDDAENAITEYYTGCPSQFTGQLPYAYDCRRFLNCWHGRGHIQTCAPGTVFNSETLECDRPDKVVCGTLGALDQHAQRKPLTPGNDESTNNRAGRLTNANMESSDRLCLPGATGLQPHPTDCTKFLNCANGNVHVQECGPGTAYSIPLMTCDFRHRVNCVGRRLTADLPSDSYECPPSVVGLYPHPSDCTKFLNCVHGTTIVQDCGPGTAFDSVKLVCDFKEKANCFSSDSGLQVSHRPKQEAGFSNSNRVPLADVLCPTGVTGLFVYPFDYTKFLNCKNGNTEIQNCVHGTVFSISKGFCDSKDQIPYTDRVSYIVSELSYEYSKSITYCPPGTDGIHLYPFDGVKYLKCINQEIIILKCAVGSAFSISRKMCLPKQQIAINDRVRYVDEILQQISSTISYGESESYDYDVNFKPSNKLNSSYNVHNGRQAVQCPNDTTGIFPFPFDCTKYLKCLNGQLNIETCTSGSVFSLSRKHCHLRENIDSKDTVRFQTNHGQEWSLDESYIHSSYSQDVTHLMCPLGINGFFLHPFDCTKYLNCHNGITTIESCASGAVFSISTRHCISRNQVEAYDRVEYLSESQHELSTELETNIITVKCPPGVDGLYLHQNDSFAEFSNKNTSIVCTPHASGFYPHPDDCTKFIICDNSVVHIHNCGPGTAWSIENKVCDLKNKVDCNGRMSFRIEHEHGMVQGSDGRQIAYPTDAYGLYPHPFVYNKYFKCKTGKCVIQNCQAGDIYSISTRNCAAEETVGATDHVAYVREFITNLNVLTLAQSMDFIICPPTSTGYHIYPFDCEKFIKCENDGTFIEDCPSGTIFSISKERCTLRNQVLRTDRVWFVTETLQDNELDFSGNLGRIICPAGITGLYQHPYDCQKFLNCANDRTLIEDCGPGRIFSLSKKSCELDGNVANSDRSNTGILPSSQFYKEATVIICTPHAKRVYPHPDDCTKFINCDNSVPHIKHCGPGTAWSIEMEVCDFKDKVNCTGRMSFGNVTVYEKLVINKILQNPTSQKFAYPANAIGLYPHPFAYNNYLNCQDGKCIVQNCQAGTVYSISIRNCAAEETVGATDHVAYVREFITNLFLTQSMEYIVCPPTSTGYHIYPFDCEKFIKCENGDTFIEDCPSGTVFSISKKRCTLQNQVLRTDRVWLFTETLRSNEINFSSRSRIVCPSGITGLYQHPYDCKKFLNCANDQTLEENCGPGRVFSLSKGFCELEGNVATSDRINEDMNSEYDYNYVKSTTSSSANGVLLSPTCPPSANGMHPHPYDCTKFLHCANGLAVIQDCAPGTFWNVFTKQCDFKDKVDCFDRVGDFTDSSESKSYRFDSEGAENDKVTCPNDVLGIQPHPFDCTKFLNCANGITQIQECAPGTAWDIAMEACNFLANVDCSTRQKTALHFIQTGYTYSNNRDSKSYSNEGLPTNQGEYYEEDNRHNSPQNNENWQNNQHQGQHLPTSSSSPQAQNNGYSDRWTNMNMARPDSNINRPNQGATGWQQSTTQDEINQQHTETDLTWSGVGSSIHKQSPSTSVHYVEGSLQPNNYGNTIKIYSAPLAPFSHNTAADRTLTTTSRTNTNIYYAQPVGSQEDSEETFNVAGPGTRTTVSRNPSVIAQNWPSRRQNHSRDINYSSSSNTWTPVVHSSAPQSQSVPILNQNFMPPYPSTPQKHPNPQDTYRQPLNIPVTHLMPPPHSDRGQRPQEDPEFGVTTINLDRLSDRGQFDISAYDQYPSGSNPSYSPPIDSSNLYGGLQPPPPPSSSVRTTTPETRYYNFPSADPISQNAPQPEEEERQRPPFTLQQPNTTPRTYLHAPLNPTDSTYRRDIQQRNPTIINSTVLTFADPHYSSPYASVTHSRNTTWPNVGRKVPQHHPSTSSFTPHSPKPTAYSGDVNSNPYQPDYDEFLKTTTERRAVLPPTFNREYYPPTVPSKFNEESPVDDKNMNDLPISDALRMLLRPYFNRSGTVSDDAADRADSHIMNLVAQAKDTNTPITTTSTTTTTTTLRPTTIKYQDINDDDVELIIAGEQHSLINILTNSSTHETRNDFHLNQKNLTTSQKSNRHTHEHSRNFHLRHPHLPNPFPDAERPSVSPNLNANVQKHHSHHHPHMEQHSREFHLRHPKVPNPFGGTREGDKSVVDQDMLDTPNPYAESTTATSLDIDLRISSIEKSIHFDCGNGKSVKTFEVCDGINNCGNRKDESRCEHLGYEIRLTGGESTNVGRVEVKVLGKWGYVCDDKFGLRDADVVCKELGFQLGANEVRGNSFYPPSDVNVPFVMDEVDCRGNESSLRECDFKGWGINNCGPDEVVGVVCKVPLYKCPNDHWLCSTSKECIPTNFVCDNTPDCQDKSDESDKICNSPAEYRLEGGRSANEGRLEVMYRGEWGTVCDDDFGLKEAQVVCNSMGYYGKPKIEKNIFGLGSGPIWLDQVSCFGNETSIDKCNHWTWGEHNCNHTEDVGIKCTAGPPPRRLSKIGRTILSPSSADDNQHELQEGQTSLEDIGLYPGQWERASKFINNQRRCGHFKDDLTDEFEHPEERVVNGSIARRGHHPWQATIRTRGRGGVSGHWCGAVLISKKHLLTAAHCLAGYPKGAYFIRMGDHYANIAESSEIDSYIENWYLHEKFRDKTHMNNDIALIVLKSPVRFNDYIQPICLPEKGSTLKENRMCTISGWGSIKSGVSTPSNILRAAQLPILKDDICKQAHVYGATVTEGMFCAGTMDESVDACDGDSGGPLVCSDEDGETLYGIISWGQQCGYANKPGVYVRVEKYIDWIFEKINFSIQQTARH